jgi:carboxyl-terminal processing protease
MRGNTRLVQAARRIVRPSLAFTLFLTGCVALVHQDQQAAFDNDAATKVFAAGYSIIQDKYIEPVTSGKIATAGLAGLTTIDAGVKADVHDGLIHLSLSDGMTSEIPAPADNDAKQWAAATANAISIARGHSKAISETSSEDLYQAVFKASLTGFDRFSRYLGAVAAREDRARREGYGGIGVLLHFDQDRVLIDDVMPETPAAEAGLRHGDRLVKIDQTEVASLDKSQVTSRLRGRVDSKVKLTLLRSDDAQPITVSMNRAHIVNPTVELEKRDSDHIAVIRISGFNQGTAASVSKALDQAFADMGDNLKGIVLDMRNNPGGLLDQAISVSDQYLTSGRIVSTRGRHVNSMQSYDANEQDESHKLPVVILVNGRSASAAEIVTAALQDDGRAVVVGSNTYGKGTVQNLSSLPNNGELILTWSVYHAPSGYALHHLGIMPNVCTSGARGTAKEVLDQLSPTWARLPLLMAAWRVSAPSAGPKLDEMRQNCPRSSDVRDLEVEVASRLIADPVLYRRALQATGTTVAAGPTP